MQRFFVIWFSYLLLLPAAVLCYAPMKRKLRYGMKKIVLFGALLLGVTTPVCAFLEYKFLTYSNVNLLFLPYCLLLYVVYHKTLRVKVSQSLMMFSLVMLWNCYANNFSVLIDVNIFVSANNNNIIGQVSQLGMNLLIAALVYYPLRRFGSELIETCDDSRVWYTGTAVSVIFILICLFLAPAKYETLYVDNLLRTYTAIHTAFFVLHLLLCVIFYFIVSGLNHTYQAEARNKFYEMRESQYLKQQRYIDENRRVHHDFKHTICTLKELADREDHEAVRAYIDQYFESMPENDTIQFCKDPAVNAVLNYYHQLAQKEQIDLNWKIGLPEDVPIKCVDLCNIIGNILDNAITACQELPAGQRWIQFTIESLHNANLYFVATNSFSGRVKLRNDRYLSTHHDGNGIGLSSIESIAESYGGTALFEHKNREFYSNVVLPTMNS